MLVQLKGIASWELRRDLSGWAVDGWEACRSQGKLGTGHAMFLEIQASPCPPGSQEVQGSAALAALQTSHSSGWSLVCSRSAGCLVSSVRCWEGYIHLLFAGACGSLICCAVGRLPEGISAPVASPAVQFP